MKIVLTQELDLFPEQEDRLHKLGEVRIYHDYPKNSDEWLERCKGADVICTGRLGLKEKIYNLHDVFLSLPFVGVGWIDIIKTTKRNITVSYCPGCNRHSVAEWIIGMMLNLSRKFPYFLKLNKKLSRHDIKSWSLFEKNVVILGKGNVGIRAGEICQAFGSKVRYFTKGDELNILTKDADFIVNCLSQNKTTINILNRDFFMSLKKECYFITVTSNKIYDADAMIEALDRGKLAGAASDCGSIDTGNIFDPYYQKLSGHKKILATPHIAARTDVTDRIANNMMIDNIENWINGKPFPKLG